MFNFVGVAFGASQSVYVQGHITNEATVCACSVCVCHMSPIDCVYVHAHVEKLQLMLAVAMPLPRCFFDVSINGIPSK